MFRKMLFGVLLALGLCGGWAVGAEKVAGSPTPASTGVGNVLITVDGEQITKNDLYLAFVQLYPKQTNDVLNQLANQILITNEAKRKKIAVSEDELKARIQESELTGEVFNTVQKMIESSLLCEKLIIEDKKIKVTDDEIKKFFDEKKSLLGEPEKMRIKQIFVLDEQAANETLLALNAGADFSKMAVAKSQDTASKEKGGDLGFFTKGMLQPDIEKVVFNMKQGEISSVVKTSVGFHIIRVEEKKIAVEAKFDNEMKKRVKKIILNSKIQEALPAWFDGLRKKAAIQ